MFRRKITWNRKYPVILVIAFSIVVYFFLPFLNENENSSISFLRSILDKVDLPAGVMDTMVLPTLDSFSTLVEDLLNFNQEDDPKVLKNQMNDLRRELQVKEVLIQTLSQLKDENDHLRSLLQYRSNSAFTLVPGEIITYQPQDHFYFFWINTGKDQGVHEKLPVIGFNRDGKQGLVGFVVESTAQHSMIQTILDPQTHVSISIQGHDTKGILKRDKNHQNLLNADYVDNKFTNLIGRKVLTLGIGERYPSGIEVGEILSSEQSVYGLFQNLIITPLIDFSVLREVFVIIPQESEALPLK